MIVLDKKHYWKTHVDSKQWFIWSTKRIFLFTVILYSDKEAGAPFYLRKGISQSMYIKPFIACSLNHRSEYEQC